MGESCGVGVEISRETFKQMSSEERDYIIFDCLKGVTKDLAKIKEAEKVDKRRVMWVASIFGFFGGASVMLGKIFLPF